MSVSAGEYGPRYEVLGEIERRGADVLLETREVDLGRLVALKVVRESHREDADAAARLAEEARIVGQLQHPGVMPVYDIGRAADERPFFTTKRTRGESLASILAAREGPEDDRPRLLRIFEQVVQTVAFAHARGVVHGELRTAAIRVGAFGEVLVEGWSAAAESRDEGPDVRALGAILGEIVAGTEHPGELAGDDVLVALARRCLARGGPGECAPRAAEVVAIVEGYRVETETRAHRARLRAIEERAQAEQARAAARDARVAAAWERRARRRTLALAAALLVAIGIASVSWWQVERGREERARRADAAVEAALQEAVRRKGRREWRDALAAAERAGELAEGHHVSPAAREPVEALLAEARREVSALREREARVLADETAIRRLEAIRIDAGAEVLALRAADARFAEVFGEIGIVPAEMAVEAAASALRSRTRPAELVAALDAWAFLRREIGEPTRCRELVELADAVDLDAARAAIREAASRSDVGALLALARELEIGEQSPRTIGLLAMALRSAGEPVAAVELLQGALFRHPDDLWILHELARSGMEAEPRRAREAVRCLVAAIALRPESAGLRSSLEEAREATGE